MIIGQPLFGPPPSLDARSQRAADPGPSGRADTPPGTTAASPRGNPAEADSGRDKAEVVREAARPATADRLELSPEAQAQVKEFRRRDQEVRAHEAAHAAAGGAHVRGGPSYSYTTGPDGKRYATGGEVTIDTSAVAGDPQATAAKMRAVRAAALAPANPSSQDLAVAARASQAEAKAQVETAQEKREEVAEAREGDRGTEAAAAGEDRAESAPLTGRGEGEPRDGETGGLAEAGALFDAFG